MAGALKVTVGISSPSIMLLFGAISFALASMWGARVAVAFALAGLLLGLFALRADATVLSARRAGGFVGLGSLAAILLASSSSLFSVPDGSVFEYAVWLLPVVMVGSIAVLRGVGSSVRMPQHAGTLMASGVAGAGLIVMLVHGGSGVGIDVLASHLAAADALADGLNPYTDAATFFDGFPGMPEGSVLEGYVYPPVTLVAYVGATWLFGDPRWLNVFLWVGLLATIVRKGYSGPGNHLSLAALTVLCVTPPWRLVVFSGWTEPLTVALVAFALAMWHRKPRLATVVLGLAIGTKQYMVVLLPLLLLVRGASLRRRLLSAQLVAFATLVPFLVWNPAAFFEAVIVRQLRQGFRPDSQSLAGLLDGRGGQLLYTFAALLLVIVVSVYLTRRALSAGELVVAAALILAAFFGVAQALVNYWFLVSSLIVVGVVWGGMPPAETVSSAGGVPDMDSS